MQQKNEVSADDFPVLSKLILDAFDVDGKEHN